MKLLTHPLESEVRTVRMERTDCLEGRDYPEKEASLACPDVMDTLAPLDLMETLEPAEIGESLDRLDMMVWPPGMVSRAEPV